MTKVMQGDRNCYAACVASLLEMDLSQIPGCFAGHTWDPYAQRRWLAERGCAQVEINLHPEHATLCPPPDVPCIFSGTGPRTCPLHAVVGKYDAYKGFVFLHDPHADQTYLKGGITGIKSVTYLLPLDPAVLNARKE